MDRFDELRERLARATANFDFLKWAEVTSKWHDWYFRNCPDLIDILDESEL